LDTSPEYYGEIITTRTYQDRPTPWVLFREAGFEGVFVAALLAWANGDRPAQLLRTLANLPEIRRACPSISSFKCPARRSTARQVSTRSISLTICMARFRRRRGILMPAAHVRLSAGREGMSDEVQALCFLAGANSIFYARSC